MVEHTKPSLSDRFPHRAKRICAAAAACILLALPLCSCSGGSDAEPAAVALVVGCDANSQTACADDPSIRDAAWPVVLGGGALSVIVPSSESEVLSTSEVSAPKNTSDTALDARYADAKGPFGGLQGIAAAVPAAEEVDLLDALRVAKGALGTASAGECASKTIYVVHSGLSTADILDFTGGGLYGDIAGADPDALVEAIVSDTSAKGISGCEAFPDLSGIHVVWLGMGRWNGGAQCDVPADRISDLKELWTAVLRDGCNADFDPNVDFKDYVAAGGSSSGAAVDKSDYPFVTPVVFESSLGDQLVTFDENVLEFAPESAEYATDYDGDRALEVLAPYAESLAKSGQKVVVLGTTAFGEDKQYCRKLGCLRAQRVKDDLVALGVPEGQVAVASAGCEGTGVKVGSKSYDLYTPNFAADGSWDEGIAKTNRAIHLVPYSLAGDVLERFSAEA